MWLILSGENHQGGSVRTALPATTSDATVADTMRAQTQQGFCSCDWVRAELWAPHATTPTRVLDGRKDGIIDYTAIEARDEATRRDLDAMFEEENP